MENLLKELGLRERFELQKEIKRIWNMSVTEYSTSIHAYQPEKEMEKELSQAFRTELERLDYSQSEVENILIKIEQHRVIQTGPHLVACYGPRMLSLDWQGSIGVGEDNYYTVGMYSSIPFSNYFLPGHLTFNPIFSQSDLFTQEVPVLMHTDKYGGIKEKKVSIISSRFQDELVYRSRIGEKTRNLVNIMTPALKPYFNFPSLFEDSHSKWALESIKKQLTYVLNKNNLIYLDIEEVISQYLIRILENENHFISKILFDEHTRNKFCQFFDSKNLFLIPFSSSSFPSQEGLRIEGQELVGKHIRLKLDPETLIKSLKNNRLCPSLLLTFTILSFLNNFKCLGSFMQSVYLPEFKSKWLASGLLKGIENVPTANLTSGYFSHEPLANIRPIDIILGMKFDPNPDMKVGEFISTIQNRLIDQ